MERPSLQDTDEDKKRPPPCSSGKEGTEVGCLRVLEGKHKTAAKEHRIMSVSIYLLC